MPTSAVRIKEFASVAWGLRERASTRKKWQSSPRRGNSRVPSRSPRQRRNAMVLPSTKTASGAARSSFYPIRLSGLRGSPPSGRALANLRPKSPSSWRPTRNTTCTFPVRQRILPLTGETKAWSSRTPLIMARCAASRMRSARSWRRCARVPLARPLASTASPPSRSPSLSLTSSGGSGGAVHPGCWREQVYGGGSCRGGFQTCPYKRFDRDPPAVPTLRGTFGMTHVPGQAPAALAADRARALEITPVSRETAGRLDRFAALLLAWQRTTNLIAESTVPCLWTRHIADSLQLIDLAPSARVWIDIGSGGGFPGLVIACALGSQAGAAVH